MSTVFRIMMHGLIALAPSTDPNDADHIIRALLPDAHMAHDTCVTEHKPKLIFVIDDIPENEGKCRDAGCEKTGTHQCTCAERMSKKKIAFDFPSLSSPVPESPDESLANNNGLPSVGTIGSMRYVAKLTKPPFNLKLLPPGLLDDHLFAQMEVPFEKLTSCSLSKREDQGDKYVVPMSVRALGDISRASDRSQALAQMVVASFDVPAGQPVSIKISNFDGTNPQSMVLAAGPNGYLIELSNEPKELARDSLCEDGVARHFAHFYELAEDPPAWPLRQVPRARWLTQGIRISGLNPDPAAAEAEECKNLVFTLMDRPICPMADFL